MVVWAIVAVGLAAGLFPRTRLPRGWKVAAAVLAALAAWTAFSLGWSDSAEKTYNEFARVLHYGGIVALAWLLLDRHTWSAAAAGVFLGAAAITCLALTSRLIPDAFPVPDLAQIGGQARRLEYPFGYWNALGAWASMTAAMGVAWAAHSRTPLMRILAAAVIPVSGAVMYLTYSRGGLFGFAAGIAVAILASHRRWSAGLIAGGGIVGAGVAVLAIRDQQQIAEALGSAGAGTVAVGVLSGAAIAAIAVVAVIGFGIDRWRAGVELTRSVAAVALATLAMVAVGSLASGFAGDVWDRIGSDPQAASQAAGDDPAKAESADRFAGLSSSRADIYSSAFNAWESAPLLGIGAGNFELWWGQHPETPEFLRDAHSLYIETLAELGPIGLALIVAWLGLLAVMVISARRATGSTRRAGAAAGALGALAVLAVQGGIDWFWEYTAVPALAIGSAAIAACGTAGAVSRPGLPRRWQLGLAGVALLVVVAQLSPWLSVRAIRSSEEAIFAGDMARARDEAERAVSLEPWAATPHVELARAHAADGRLPAAVKELRLAIDREPTNWRHRAQLAGVLLAKGDTDAAGSARDSALRFYRLPEEAVDFVVGEMQRLAS